MAKIKITMEDDHGDQIGEPQEYELEVGRGTLAEIEAAVEKLKRESLPEIERRLLTEAQAQAIKKTNGDETGPWPWTSKPSTDDFSSPCSD
jgi:hypothetical protein